VKVSELKLDDLEQIQDYLGSFDIFAGNEAEGIGYLTRALLRFLITLEMIPPVPESGGRLLELGANPYFLTLLMKKYTGYELALTNYFGEIELPGGRGIQAVCSERYGERHEFHYQHFNGEADTFPYPDSAFDVVLNCEILEHLTMDPTHLLCECHRVLRPGGHLLLTTPNVLTLQNLWALGKGKNFSDHYSGYGVYGRHNREYTPSEVVDLLLACGFTVTQVRLEDIAQHSGLKRLLKSVRQHWRDNIFVLAQAHGQPLYGYPAWLYRSMQSLRRVVRSDIVMGENDAIQLGPGWHPLEHTDVAFRWTSAEARAYLLNVPHARRLGIRASTAFSEIGPTRVTVTTGSLRTELELAESGWHEFYVPLPESRPTEIEIQINVEPTHIPRKLGWNVDERVLGIMVCQMGIQ
jgi:SAM-dependent methyltransferase